MQPSDFSTTSQLPHKAFANASFTMEASKNAEGLMNDATPRRTDKSGLTAMARALGAGALGLLLAAPAAADVRAGVEAWSRGEYAAAVSEWEGPAAAGDADALFNLGQAHRLGRGVPTNLAHAEQLYARAAALGHVQAADTYGLLLFQDGRRDAALPYVTDAARRGDPRAQYLLGVSHFNGDLVPRDWVRAYALVTLANAAGLPQAAGAVAEMDQNIPLPQRQEGASLAVELEREANAARALELAAAELGTAPAALPAGSPAEPAEEPPMVAEARAAVAEAASATGTEDPATAGARFAGGSDTASPAPTAAPPPTPSPASSPTPSPQVADAPAPTPDAASGPWRVQLGAFSVAQNADRLWTRLSGRPELAGAERIVIREGRLSRLLAGGFATRAAADAACRALRQTGQDCLVTRS